MSLQLHCLPLCAFCVKFSEDDILPFQTRPCQKFGARLQTTGHYTMSLEGKLGGLKKEWGHIVCTVFSSVKRKLSGWECVKECLRKTGAGFGEMARWDEKKPHYCKGLHHSVLGPVDFRASLKQLNVWLKLQSQEALVFPLLHGAGQRVWLALNQANFIVSALSPSASSSSRIFPTPSGHHDFAFPPQHTSTYPWWSLSKPLPCLILYFHICIK